MENKDNETKNVTRAEKRDNVKKLIRELLSNGNAKASDLIDGAAKLYAERFGGEDTENPNDVKGRVGSVLDVMKKESDVLFEGGVYALNTPKTENITETKPAEKTEETPVKKPRARAKNTAETTADKTETAEKTEKPAKTKKTTAKKKSAAPLPPAPLQPIAPTAPTTPENAPEPLPQDKANAEENAAPKKRGRKPRAEVKVEVKTDAAIKEQPQPVTEIVAPPKAEEKTVEKTLEKAEETPPPKTDKKEEVSPKGTLMDMSFLFGEVKPAKPAQPVKAVQAEKAEKTEKVEQPAKPVLPVKQDEKQEQKQSQKQAISAGKPEPKTTEQKKTEPKKPVQKTSARGVKKPLTADEKLQEAFLSRLHRLGGEYFEYYSVYLLEKYSRQNGRRLEGLKITGGDHDGGIDGEIELTDKLGFRETIYIQSKNWDPSNGDEKLWVVGETLLQQFIGACVCRQAKDGKQNCRGIFITTSRFTPDAKRILDDTIDKFVGYDGADLYETAKECSFGLVKKNGEWALDEELLSGTKAFFNMY